MGTEAADKAEALIEELGISSPQELDVEAIAFDSGVQVRYEPLVGCEASLVGFEDVAIATINPSGSRGRERFSIAHELGHWHLHRGRSFECRVDDADLNLASPNRALERQADTFAAHLLMPQVLFGPLVRQMGDPNFKNLRDLAETFDTSLMATALRLANVNQLPVIVAAYNGAGRRWSVGAPDTRRWVLNQTLDEDSFTYDLLHQGKECKGLFKQSADVWFENDDAGEYEVREQCIASSNGDALVLLYLDSRMVGARPDWNVRRRFNEHGSYFAGGKR